jgi:AcrR family transcriptional regulator
MASRDGAPLAPADDGPASVREEHRRVTRQRLMRAALDVFGRSGYGATTVEDLVARAGVARGTFYLHFDNKLAVVRALSQDLEPSVAMLYEELDDLLTTGSRAAIRAWMVRAFDWFDAHTTMVRVWREIAVSDPGFMVMPMYFIADHMPKYLAQWPGQSRQAARLRVVLLVNQLAESFNQSHIRRQLDVDDDLLMDTLTDLWISALQAPAIT